MNWLSSSHYIKYFLICVVHDEHLEVYDLEGVAGVSTEDSMPEQNRRQPKANSKTEQGLVVAHLLNSHESLDKTLLLTEQVLSVK